MRAPGQPLVDFRNHRFVDLIERSPLWFWQRSRKCACAPASEHTRQADPTCDVCNGTLYVWYGPEESALDQLDPDVRADIESRLTDQQRALLTANPGSLIRGFTRSVTQTFDSMEEDSGSHSWSQCLFTCRGDNASRTRRADVSQRNVSTAHGGASSPTAGTARRSREESRAPASPLAPSPPEPSPPSVGSVPWVVR